MAPFAGWEMPVHFAAGVLAEHLHTRAGASLFDVSHMGQVVLRPRRGMEALLADLEALTPADLLGLPEGRQRYALLTAEGGGILDDVIVARAPGHLVVVVNASRREADLAHLRDHLPGAEVEDAHRALLAVQGPGAEAALAALLPAIGSMRFMDSASLSWEGAELWASRSGYTGEDGFEVSVPPGRALAFAEALLAAGARPAGLGARDSLRLEAGLPLHGTDIDATTTPVAAALAWSIGKARRPGGARAGGYPGAAAVEADLRDGPPRRRVGLRPDGRQPVRGGSALVVDGAPAGAVTSGTFGPTLQAPVAMGYVAAALAVPGTALAAEVRGRALPVTVAPLPFVPPRFQRRGSP
jgi:aminomethyltransferase